jgi:murein DD-endopeptidase MepM/ murein hydrolase activator NlpD
VTRLRTAAGISFALLLTVGNSAAQADHLHDRIIQNQKMVHDTHARLQVKKGQLSANEQRSEALKSELRATYGDITQANAELDRLQSEVRWNQHRLAWNKRQLDAAQDSLRRQDDALRRHIVSAYKYGDLGYINVLLSSTSFSDFVERWDDIRLLIATNERTVRGRREAQRRVAQARRALEAQEIALEAADAQIQQEQERLAGLAQEKKNLLAAVKEQQRRVAAQIVQLEEVSAQEEAELTALIQERQREEEARREAQRRAALLLGQKLPQGFGEAPRTLAWPAFGPITSPFGFRPDPFTGALRMHPGIDIGIASGTTVAAAAAGRVIVVETGYSGGYGNHIVIDHGGGIATLYAHLSQIFVAEGQDVQQGQAIGASGSTGYSTGPHLHFEVRLKGTPINPLGWLR